MSNALKQAQMSFLERQTPIKAPVQRTTNTSPTGTLPVLPKRTKKSKAVPVTRVSIC